MSNYIQPLIGMMSVTAGVWSYMYVTRLRYVSQNNILPENIDTPPKLEGVLPDNINLPSYNFNNLFQMPVIFYALCIICEILRMQGLLTENDWLYATAWVFVLLRLIHSIIHCTYNKVMHRFIAYFLSCILLWIMAVKVAFIAWS